jgi:membrane protein implicated in regulation of membrane protease activity
VTMDLLRIILYICLCIGFLIPLLDILLGNLDFSDNIDFDGLIPFNVMCLSFALIVFSSSGLFFMKFMTNSITGILLLGVSLIASIIAYTAVYKFIVLKLKANNPLALKSSDLIGLTGIVVLRITPDSEGVISLKDSTGANITYRAALSAYAGIGANYVINQGQEVIISDFDSDKKICYVILPKGKQ